MRELHPKLLSGGFGIAVPKSGPPPPPQIPADPQTPIRNFWIELTDCEWISPESDPQEFERLAIRNGDVGYNRWLEFWEYPSAFADNFQTMHITSNADWDEAHPAGTSLDDVLQVRINSSSDFVHDGYDMGEYKYEFLQNYDYLKTIEKRPSELTAADMKMVYYSLTDFSSQTKSPVIVFTSAPTLEKEHTLTLRWTTVEGDVKTASITCTPEVDPALQ